MDRCPNCKEEFNGAVCFNCGYKRPPPSWESILGLFGLSVLLGSMGYGCFIMGAVANSWKSQEAVPLWVVAGALAVGCVVALVLAWKALMKR